MAIKFFIKSILKYDGVCGNSKDNTANPIKKKHKIEKVIDENTMQRIECIELSKVRILVLYTPAAVPSITTTTNLAMQQMRTALSNSSVDRNDLQIEVAGIIPFNFTETSDIDADVNRLSLTSSAQSLRNTYQADLVVLMSGNYVGNLSGYTKSLNQDFEGAYSIVAAPYAASSNLAFIHEVGHLMGGRHEENNDPRGTIEHGYCFRPTLFSAKKSTVMSVVVDNHILHYSNPNRYYAGCPTGTSNSNNVAQHFRNAGRKIAAHFPNTPGNFYTSIIGSQTPCPWQDNWYEADVRCGTPPFTIQWHTSTNGVNYIYRASGEFYLFQAPMQNGTATTIRMTVRGSNGITQTRYIQTTSYSPSNSLSCDGSTGNGFRTEKENNIITKVSPNPVEGKAKLYVELPKEDTQIQILIVDSFRKTIQILDTSKFIQKGEFDISGLSTGLYYISIHSQINGLHSITIHVK
ncbi:M12 family metallo-peptidase [Bernardetia sp. OM2101]|uniref:M12 family metallo-peptidase n=1 Tax=Bernardetia sp. OM2101 TaxID=3344876 RepID=UPI0035D06764